MDNKRQQPYVLDEMIERGRPGETYNVGGNGGYPSDNPGLEQFTGLATDEGKFRAPSLRNIMVTGPYFHDGSAAMTTRPFLPSDEQRQVIAHRGGHLQSLCRKL